MIPIQPEYYEFIEAAKESAKGTTKSTTKSTTKNSTKSAVTGDLPGEGNGMPGQIVSIMRDNPNVTAKEIAEKTGITVDGVYYHIKKLKKTGAIVREGEDFNGFWKIVQ